MGKYFYNKAVTPNSKKKYPNMQSVKYRKTMGKVNNKRRNLEVNKKKYLYKKLFINFFGTTNMCNKIF